MKYLIRESTQAHENSIAHKYIHSHLHLKLTFYPEKKNPTQTSPPKPPPPKKPQQQQTKQNPNKQTTKNNNKKQQQQTNKQKQQQHLESTYFEIIMINFWSEIYRSVGQILLLSCALCSNLPYVHSLRTLACKQRLLNIAGQSELPIHCRNAWYLLTIAWKQT